MKEKLVWDTMEKKKMGIFIEGFMSDSTSRFASEVEGSQASIGTPKGLVGAHSMKSTQGFLNGSARLSYEERHAVGGNTSLVWKQQDRTGNPGKDDGEKEKNFEGKRKGGVNDRVKDGCKGKNGRKDSDAGKEVQSQTGAAAASE